MDQTTTGYAVAEFDFTASDTDELSFSAGDIIRVLAKHNDDWWEGQVNGKTGMFPRNRCVETTLVDPHIAEDTTRIPTPNTADISNQCETMKSGTSESDASQVSPAGGQWKQVTNPEGATYYYNTATQETLWHLPETKNADSGLGEIRRPSEVRAACTQKSLPPDYSIPKNADAASVRGNEAAQETGPATLGRRNSPSPIETNGRTSRPVSLHSPPPSATPPVIPSLSPAKIKRTSMLIPEVIPPTPDVANDDDVGLDAGVISLKSNDGDDEEDINSNPSGAFIKFDDEEGAMFDPLSMDYVKKEGGLNRKLEKLEGGKAASRQSWKMVYTAIGSGYLLFFKDKISKMKKSDKMVRPLGCFDLQGVVIEQATKANTKKKNVFVLSAPSGEQLLFQADNEQDMNSWLEAIRQDRQRHANDSSMEPVAAVVGLIRKAQMERDTKVAKLKQSRGKGSLQVIGLDDVDKSKEKKVKTRGKRGNSIASQASFNSDFSEDAQDKQKVKSKLGRFFSTRPTLDNLKEKGILAQELVFGGDLDCKGRTVPAVVELCVNTVEKRGLDCVGIYRLSGNAASIQKLRFAFNQDEDVKLEREQDVNVVAGVLKLYFRELSNPLMTFECYDMLIEAAKLQDYDSRMLAIKDLVHTLPKPNFDTLRYLMEHLVKVAAKGDVNKMEPSNLAIVFGPTLMRPREETFKTICNTGVQNSVIESMILQCDWMFKKT